ncbi:MAG: Uncharacterised protein [SAR116 cluster bacterium]|nr:MAG: Uncharacterised protein [SAR116 cluster bacterium]
MHLHTADCPDSWLAKRRLVYSPVSGYIFGSLRFKDS